MSTKECLVQLCTSQSEFDGEWKWQAAGMSYLIRTKGNRFLVIDGGENQEDAMRLVKKMPKWKPGTQRGVPVRVKFTLPVVFKL